MAEDWFDELVLDPAAHPVAMGIRSLGDRPWLVHDADRSREIELKTELLASNRDAVLHTTDASVPAAAALAQLVGAEPSDVHPIERAALAVQADLCLLQRRESGWFLDASCLCFPTRWHLREKVGHHIAHVHGPVDGYHPRITNKVDQLFDRLTERPVWRRNWFLMTDPTLHQPDRPPTETIIPADRVMTELYVRSERQTLRRVIDDWVVFTIRIQQLPLGQLLTSTDRSAAFAGWVEHVSDDFGRRRHLTPPQRHELLTALKNTRG
jgi:hypothetical protein